MRSSKPSSSKSAKSAPVKAYIEVGGDVHTVRAAVGGVGSADELRSALEKACMASGAPELKSLSLAGAEIQYLSGTGGAPAMVTDATEIELLRGARAFRVLFQ